MKIRHWVLGVGLCVTAACSADVDSQELGDTSADESDAVARKCATGKANCDGNDANGCETDLATNQNNCGACGSVCYGVCDGGTCRVCRAKGTRSCDNDPTNGCETNINTSQFNCGGCGNYCSGLCTAGVCSPCLKKGSANCDQDPNNTCEQNVFTDPNNCGRCGSVCHGICTNGVCIPKK